jgi:hypothetical protein
VTPKGDTTLIFADSSEVVATTGIWAAASYDTVRARELVIPGIAGPLRMRVDPRGTLVAMETQFGVRWERDDFSMARFNYRRGLLASGDRLRAALPTVLQLSAAALPADTSDRPVTYAVSRRQGGNIPGALFVLVEGARQHILPGVNRISVEAVSPGRLADEAVDPLIQVDDATVMAFSDSLGASVLIEDVLAAVRGRVTIDTAVGAPIDAAGALRVGTARPEGMARLAVALLRRHRFGAQLAIGVLPRGDTLYTHAWVEVRDPRTRLWSAIDPARGGRASNHLIRVAGTGSSHPMELLPRIADVRFEEILPSDSLQE